MDHDPDYYGDRTIDKLKKRIEHLQIINRSLYLKIDELEAFIRLNLPDDEEK